jgi:hypothetical protein
VTTSSEQASALAPAAIAFSLCVGLTQLRMDDTWANGVLLLVAAVPAAVLVVLGLSAAVEGFENRAATTMLLVAGLFLAAVAILRLGQVLAGDDDVTGGGGTLTWMLLLFTGLAAYCSSRTRSVACLLIAALASVGLLLEAVNWIFGTDDPDVFRALLTLSFLVLFLAGVSTSGRPGTVLVAAAGVTVIVSSYLFGLFFVFLPGGATTGWGWELVMLLEGVALLAYAASEFEPGPGYLAFFVLVLFVMTAASGDVAIGGNGEPADTLVGWPLTLAIVTVVVGALALRRTPRA